ncbi:XRE family transcriptional regulator [Pantoea dispersa]|uniref:XRE family transcriptional regulator n=1 Tax=Pantoea dispersa TaxID=59814 RepID=UPI000A994041|nr:XRE family transcriptional regulator [Pantoea dispersa]
MTTHVHALPTFGNQRLYNFSNFNGKQTSSKQGLSVSKPLISGIFVTMLLGSGTGAAYDMHNIDEWFSYVKDKAPAIGELPVSASFDAQIEATPDLRSPEEHLANVRNIIALPMSELAKELNVTRQALYKWLSSESQPDSLEKIEHIKRLSAVADLLRENQLSNGKSLVKMKVFSGASLLDVLKTSPDWEEKAQTLVNEAVAMKETAKNSGMLNSKAQSSTDWLSGESISGAIVRDNLG